MAITGTQIPSISPWTWAEFIGVNPWYFSQFDTGFPVSNRAQCEAAWLLYPWQSLEHLTRQDVYQALYEAERIIRDVTGIWPAPRFFQEKVNFPTSYNVLNYNYPYDYRGYPKSIHVSNRKLIQAGSETLTAVDTVAVVLSDTTGDGLDETFTATVTVPAGTATTELIAVFTETDRNAKLLQDWQIYPINVSITGTTATIRGKAYQLVKPDLQLGYDADGLDAGEASNYVDEITIYRQTTNLSATGYMIWENILWNDCTAPCAVTMATSCFGLRDADAGLFSVSPAEYNATTEAFTRTYPERYWRGADRVLVNYRAGLLPDETGRIPYRYRNAIILLATALLPNRACGCDRADLRIQHYRNMPTDGQSNNVVNTITHLQAVEQFFGVTGRGAIQAYNLIKNEIDVTGVIWSNE